MFLAASLVLLFPIVYAFLKLAFPHPRGQPVPTPHELRSPLTRFSYTLHAPRVLAAAVRRFNGATFHFTTLRGTTNVVVTRPELIREVAGLPESVSSFPESTRRTMQFDHTLPEHMSAKGHAPPSTKAMNTFLRGQLGVGRLDAWLPAVHEEVRVGLAQEVVEGRGVDLSPLISRVVIRSVLRFLAGPKVCRDPEWITHSIAHVNRLGRGGFLTSLAPGNWAKWFVARYVIGGLESKRFLHKAFAELRDDIVKEKGEKKEEEKTLFETLLAGVGKSWTWGNVLSQSLVTQLAGLHTTTFTTTTMLVALLHDAEALSTIRAELSTHLPADKPITLAALDNLTELEDLMTRSFMAKPISTLNLRRDILAPHMLSDGTMLAPGMIVSCISACSPLSPHNEIKPKEFTDTSTPAWLTFGFGRHACPGRHFAAAVVKIVVAEVLRDFEVGFADEEAEREKFGRERPTFEGHPGSPSAMVVFKRRKE